MLRPLAEKPGLEPWEKIVNFTKDEWFPSRLPFGKFKGRIYQEAREDAELQSWLEWLAESTNERSSAMGRWYLACCLSGKLERGKLEREPVVERSDTTGKSRRSIASRQGCQTGSQLVPSAAGISAGMRRRWVLEPVVSLRSTTG